MSKKSGSLIWIKQFKMRKVSLDPFHLFRIVAHEAHSLVCYISTVFISMIGTPVLTFINFLFTNIFTVL